MKHTNTFFTKAHWLVDLFCLLGVVLFAAGEFIHPGSLPEVLSRIFVDAGAAIAVAGIIAHLLS